MGAQLLRVAAGSMRVVGVIAGTVLLVGFTAGSRPSAIGSAHRCWVDGDHEGALAGLEMAPPGRERELNKAIVRLYAGNAPRAESDLAELCRRDPRWTPAVRWLARAQSQLGENEALDSAAILLGMPGADARDHLWAGRLYLEKGELTAARTAFLRVVHDVEGMDLGWEGLAEAEARLGNTDAARAAERRAAALRAGESTASGAPTGAGVEALDDSLLSAGLHPGEILRYRVRYLFLNLGLLTLETGERIVYAGRPAHRVVFTAKSNPGIPFFRIDSRFESVVGADGAVLAHRHVSSDSASGDDMAGYDMDRDARRCTVRTVMDGLFGYDLLPLPRNAQDGVSVLLVARAVARTHGSAVVPTAVASTWRATRLRTLGTERFRWRGQDLQTVRTQSVGHYGGPGGLSGAVEIWISDDERALPLRVKMRVAVGSVRLELLSEEPTGAGPRQ